MDAPRQKSALLDKYLPFAVWLPLLAAFAAIHLGTDRFGGNDGYYHIKYAWLLWHEGAVWDFPWLRGTFFHESWVDTEFLYHVFLIPFTLPGDLYLAGKIAPVFWGSLAIFSVYWTIRDFGEPGSVWQRNAWWSALVLVAASHGALYRMSMPRVPAVSLIFMMVAMLLLERRNYRWLAVLGFFYAWMYPVSVVLIPLALFYEIGRWYDTDTWSWRSIVAVAGGVLAGFIVNPYFPGTLPVLFNHVVEIGIGTSSLPKGNEWAPYDSWFMFRNAYVAWVALFVGGLAMIGTPTRGRHLTLLAAVAMMMLAYFKSRRFVEYWPFFSVLFSAGVLHDALRAPESLLNRVRDRIPAGLVPLVPILLTAFLVGVSVKNIRKTTKEVGRNAVPTRLAGAATWLRDNTEAGTQVYNVQWDVFPELIFYNHHNHWTLGLDPNFTYEVEPRLYYTSVAVASGHVVDPGRFISKYFGAKYVLSLKDTAFSNKAKHEFAGLKELYSDDTAAVYRVVPVPGKQTLEGELEPYESNLAEDQGRCAYRQEPKKGGGQPRVFLRCRLKRPAPVILKYKVDISEPGEYGVLGRVLVGASEGTAQVFVAGKKLGDPIDLSADERGLTAWKRIGRAVLRSGSVLFEIHFFPTLSDDPDKVDKRSKKWPVEVGFDALRISRLKATAPSSPPAPGGAVSPLFGPLRYFRAV